MNRNDDHRGTELSHDRRRALHAQLRLALDELSAACERVDRINGMAKQAGVPRRHPLRRLARQQSKRLNAEFTRCLSFIDLLR